MSHTIFVAAMTAVVSAAFGLIFGALLTRVRRLHELLENKQAELLRIKAHAEMRCMEDEAMLDAMKQKIRTLEQANELYEAALKAGFPEGAKGEVFYNWNEARYLTGRSYLGVKK